MTRDCKRCGFGFEVDEALDARIKARFTEGEHGHLVCAVCVLKAIEHFEDEDTSDDVVWIPEHPSMAAWRAKEPTRSGKLGEVTHLLTRDAAKALQFATREECEAWIAANPRPVFVATSHLFMRAELAKPREGG